MQWYLKALRNYVGFEGRARRKEYWFFQLFYGLGVLLVNAPFWIIALTWIATGTASGLSSGLAVGYAEIALGIVSILWWLIHLLPGIAVTVRRFHDTGRSGFWYLLGIFLPVIGTIWLFVLTVLDSEPGENQYGPNPKEALA